MLAVSMFSPLFFSIFFHPYLLKNRRHICACLLALYRPAPRRKRGYSPSGGSSGSCSSNYYNHPPFVFAKSAEFYFFVKARKKTCALHASRRSVFFFTVRVFSPCPFSSTFRQQPSRGPRSPPPPAAAVAPSAAAEPGRRRRWRSAPPRRPSGPASRGRPPPPPSRRRATPLPGGPTRASTRAPSA